MPISRPKISAHRLPQNPPINGCQMRMEPQTRRLRKQQIIVRLLRAKHSREGVETTISRLYRKVLEFEDDAGGYFGAVLVNTEVARAEHVAFQAKAEAVMGRHQVHASANLIGKGVLSPERSLRRKARVSEQAMGEDFQAAREGIAETRAYSA